MEVYGLIVKSLKHSFSKPYFEQKFKEHKIENAEYRNFEFELIDEVKVKLSEIRDLKGLNVTIPYKSAIIPYLESMDEVSEKTGAVNTVRIESDGKWTGFNTDVYGFATSIKPFLTNRHEKALILGTGGASKAVEYALKQLNISVVKVSRTKGKADLTYDDLNEYVFNACKLIINTTPVGTWPDVEESPNIPYDLLTPEHLVYDLIYNPEKTLFLKQAELAGATIMNGLNMLKLQAEKSWEIWNN
jgi:shikimate dehydrogenase